MILAAIVTATAFTTAGFLGARLGYAACAGVQPFADGPRPGRAPVLWLVAVCGVLGAAFVVHGDGVARLALSALVCLCLVACWCSDVRCGIVPDAFTLLPLAAVLLVGVLEREWWHLSAALVLVIPFATAALVSKGRAMGWGDVKLAALGGAVLGIGSALLGLAVACVVAAGVAWISGKRREPIAFAPYIAGAIGLCLLLGNAP